MIANSYPPFPSLSQHPLLDIHSVRLCRLLTHQSFPLPLSTHSFTRTASVPLIHHPPPLLPPSLSLHTHSPSHTHSVRPPTILSSSLHTHIHTRTLSHSVCLYHPPTTILFLSIHTRTYLHTQRPSVSFAYLPHIHTLLHHTASACTACGIALPWPCSSWPSSSISPARSSASSTADNAVRLCMSAHVMEREQPYTHTRKRSSPSSSRDTTMHSHIHSHSRQTTTQTSSVPRRPR